MCLNCPDFVGRCVVCGFDIWLDGPDCQHPEAWRVLRSEQRRIRKILRRRAS